MAVLDDLQKHVSDVLSARGALAKTAMVASATTRRATDAVEKIAPVKLPGLGGPSVKPPVAPAVPLGGRLFNPFSIEEQQQAVEFASRLMRIADGKDPLTGIVDAMAAVLQEVATGFAGMAQFALKLFLLHHPEARKTIRLGRFEERQPNLAAPSGPPVRPSKTAAPTEDLLNFWREDPLTGDHHDHFHLVNPGWGRPDKSGQYVLQDRHGELFAYMHKQMLARYDAERLAVGLPRVAALNDLKAPIPEGCDPKRLKLWDGKAWTEFDVRPPDTRIPDEITVRGTLKRAQLEQARDLLLKHIEAGSFEVDGKKIPITIDSLGSTEETSIGSVDFKKDAPPPDQHPVYGNHHGWGHNLIALWDNQQPMGPIGVLETAPRDAAFWRWHKHCDDVFDAWYKKQAPYDFSSDVLPVKVQDVILCCGEGLPRELDGAELASEAFGGEHWDDDFSSRSVTLSYGKTLKTTNELLTEMTTRVITIVDENGKDQKVEIWYLSHEDFAYFVRLENTSGQDETVTVRLFLVPETLAEDYRAWIEMDRFLFSLKARECAVAYRPSELSSVVRKRAIKPADLERGVGREFYKYEEDENQDLTETGAREAWCDCGWPYTLLLPRGTKEGMPFKLLAMVSPGSDLKPGIDTGARCTSISFCGLADEKYPDSKPMGYPFDRPFSDTISSTIARNDNWASRHVKIRCKNL